MNTEYARKPTSSRWLIFALFWLVLITALVVAMFIMGDSAEAPAPLDDLMQRT